MDDDTIERRNRHRFELAYETNCIIPLQKNVTKPIVGRVDDLSQTGLRMRTNVRPGMGETLSGTLQCAESGLSEEVKIEVVYVASTTSSQFEIGAKFLPPIPLSTVDKYVTRPM